MGKTYVRVDDRLIHGQTIVAWAPTLGIQEIVGVDDVSAKNAMLKSIMTMSVPKTYKTHIVTTDEAKTILEKETEKTATASPARARTVSWRAMHRNRIMYSASTPGIRKHSRHYPAAGMFAVPEV